MEEMAANHQSQKPEEGERTQGKGLLDPVFDYINELKRDTESVKDIKEELAAQEAQEKKPSSLLKKILIGIIVFLLLGLPEILILIWHFMPPI